MPVSESGQIIERILARGHNMETIGRVVGTDRSSIRQIRLGKKPGTNLTAALGELERRILELPPGDKAAARQIQLAGHEHRQTAAGKPAKVRHKRTRETDWYSTSTLKKQATRNGGRSLARQLQRTADAEHDLAVTVGVDKSLTVQSDYQSRRVIGGAGGSFDMALGPAATVAAAVRDQYDGNLSAYVAAQALERGLIAGAADPASMVAHMTSLELRSFRPKPERTP